MEESMVAIRIRDRMVEDLTLRGLSPNTIESYVMQAQMFCDYYGKSPLKLGEEEVRAYLLRRLERVSASTAKVSLAGLKFLYRVTLKRPEVVANIPFPKGPQRLPEILTGSEVASWLDLVTPLKHRMIGTLMYAMGLRITEARTLRAEHIDSGLGVLHVRQGKGRRDRDLPLHPKLLDKLREYWRIARPPRRGYLFPGDEGHPISPEACNRALKRAARKAGIRKRVSAHTLRHCYATHTLQLGANPVTIQKLLGHASIVTTLRYLRMVPEHLARVKNPFELLGTQEADILR
jgi:site-specific recombinase XerD